MADHPLLFTGPMIRALLREIDAPGTGKSQTRRIIKPQPELTSPDQWHVFCAEGGWIGVAEDDVPERATGLLRTRPSDRLWCREEHYQFGHWEVATGKLTKGGREKWQFVPDSNEVRTDAPSEFRKGRHHQDPFTPAWHKRLGRFMFRRHSRLTIYVTEVRVERLNSISEADARAEGVECDSDGWRDYLMPQTQCCASAKDSYRTLWGQINGAGAWDANPWVVAYTFTPRLGNIDTLPATIQEAA